MTDVPFRSRNAEPPWGEKVAILSAELERCAAPYAFGGAIALNYHREPRSTLDIDINIFLPPERQNEILNALATAYEMSDRVRVEEQLRTDGQARTLWGDTYVDLFFANTDFHESMASRLEVQPFGQITIPVLSIEDLLICKAIFDRPKDWLDIEAVAQTERSRLDYDYIHRWLSEFWLSDDPRHARLDDIRVSAR